MKNNAVMKNNESYLAKVTDAKKRAEAQAEAMKRNGLVKEYVSMKKRNNLVSIPSELAEEVNGRIEEFNSLIMRAEEGKAEAIHSLCKIVASSVVRKLLQVSGKNSELEHMRATIYKAVVSTDTMGDGNELVNVAVASFFEEKKRAEEEGRKFSLLDNFMKEKLAKRTYKSGAVFLEKKTEETSVYREMFRAVRSCIACNRSVNTEEANRHYYINYEKCTALINGSDEVFYIAHDEVDSMLSVLPSSVREKIVSASLSALQLRCLSLMFKGMGLHEIAYTLYGRSDDSEKQLKKIERAKSLIKETRKKCAFIFGEETKKEELHASAKRAVVVYDISGNKLHTFDSVSNCAKTLMIERRNIIHVLNGGRKQTGGYIFKYM